MKKMTASRKLNLKKETLRSLQNHQLAMAAGGAARPRTYGCPSVDTVSCLPPKSDGCFTEVNCPTITQ